MLECHLQALHLDDPGLETPAETRDRLRATFPAGATRRMTQLGMLVSAALEAVAPGPDDAVVYASSYGESRALEAYLDSFPDPRPTLFQTSVHPSGVQQGLILRQHPVRKLIPISAGPGLPVHALLAAMLAPAPRVVVCGGEGRGTWLLEHGVASARTFALAFALTREAGAAPLARVALRTTDDHAPARGALPLAEFFDLLQHRRSWSGQAAPGWELTWDWI